MRASHKKRLERRDFLQHGLIGLAALLARPVVGCGSDSGGADNGGAGGAPKLRSRFSEIGPLAEPDVNGVAVPEGFTARIVARSGQRVLDTSDYNWHTFPDGGATFATDDGGWIYVSNSELPLGSGGVGALRFDKEGTLVGAYPILQGSSGNCAGGKMPWNVWLSCEEVDNGKVFECDPFGNEAAVERPALGIFKHEAACYDPSNHHVYLSEDQSDGRFYRFVPDALAPNGFADLGAGQLEVMQVGADEHVVWLPVPDPQLTGTTPTRLQVAESTAFRGGEGLFHHDGVVYLSTKGDNRIWAYDIAAQTMHVLYDPTTSDNPILTGVDNLTASCCGDILVAEDGGDMQIVALLPDGTLKPIMQIPSHTGSEVTGPAFDPSGTRLYFSSQRGEGGGITYEISGPFHSLA
jgi:secreted PhoX family phosphatase